MLRRVVYIVVAVVALNVLLMAGMWVRAATEDTSCDVGARGLVVREDDTPTSPWKPFLPPHTVGLAFNERTGRWTDQPPCKGVLRTEVDVYPG